jgi:hypothetical protein
MYACQFVTTMMLIQHEKKLQTCNGKKGLCVGEEGLKFKPKPKRERR